MYFFFVLHPPGKVGPPKLGIRKKENQIIVDIFHPLITVNGKEPEAMYDDENACYTFTYTVFVSVNGSEVCVSISSFSTLKFSCCLHKLFYMW